jgi:hypothetical protein
MQFAQEMLANSMNDISFNPRSMQFEENISYEFHASRAGAFEVGLSYRCKHDIDNTDPANSDVTPLIDSNTQKRVLILGSIYAVEEARMSLLDVLGVSDAYVPADFYLRLDVYPLREDNRFPSNANGTSWSNVLGSLTVNMRIDIVPLSLLTIYLDANETQFIERGSFFSQDNNARLEVGFHFNGAVGGIDAFASFEHLFDDLSVPIPRASNTVSVGLRIN